MPVPDKRSQFIAATTQHFKSVLRSEYTPNKSRQDLWPGDNSRNNQLDYRSLYFECATYRTVSIEEDFKRLRNRSVAEINRSNFRIID